jgi:shikimate kinase
MEHLHSISRIVYLKISYEEMETRIGNVKDRGVAIPDGYTLKDLYDEREKLYAKYADITVDEQDKTLGMVVDELQKMFESMR